MVMDEMDWGTIREDYVGGNDSYRSLAEKYGVGLTALTRLARAEGWAELRRKRRASGNIVRIDSARGEPRGEEMQDDGGERAGQGADSRSDARRKAARKLRRALENMDEAAVSAGIRRKALLILDRMFDECAEISATEQRFVEDGVTNVRKLRDMTAIYKELTGGAGKAEKEDVEDLSALGELLRE